MIAPDSGVKGWCPGALRPMPGGDGLIVRLRIGVVVGLELAAEIARWSLRWGNGQIDLTSRANLQLRGVGPETLAELRDALLARGLLDASPEAEAVRNVIAAPLAGLDPDAVLDIRPLVAKLEQRLTGDSTLHALPAKFGFAIDDCGRFGLGDAPADVRFAARRADDGPVFDIRLDGAPDFRLGPCARRQATWSTRPSGSRRRSSPPTMRRRTSAGCGIGSAAPASTPSRPPSRWPRRPVPRPRIAPASAYLGVHPLGAGAFVGVGLPFGRIAAQDLAALAEKIARLGGQELRLTPWRSLLVPLPSAGAAQELAAVLVRHETPLSPLANDLPNLYSHQNTPSCAGLTRVSTPIRPRQSPSIDLRRSTWVRGSSPRMTIYERITNRANAAAPTGEGDAPFILDAYDPLRRVAACVGAPACLRATTDIRADAVRLAKAPFAGTLHVSGCAKGCAHPRSAALTLVGRDGRYDLIRGGAPWDAPRRRSALQWLRLSA